MTVYAADDEILALELLSEAIKEAIPGVEPVCFDNPDLLIEAAEKKAPDIVFLDINMPETNGIEVAEKLNSISGTVKIIFVTGYSEYAGQAFDVYAFGYIMKPCRAESIKKLIDKIQIPLRNKKNIVIKTFGDFEVYCGGKPVAFRSKMAKELLAYLVDREGAKISRQEAAGILYGDDYSHSVQVGLSKIAGKLAEDLTLAGAEGFFSIDNGYYVSLTDAECDFIECKKGNGGYSETDKYLAQYSWAEYRRGFFEELKNRI